MKYLDIVQVHFITMQYYVMIEIWHYLEIPRYHSHTKVLFKLLNEIFF